MTANRSFNADHRLGAFPRIRQRRTRATDWQRRMVRENQVTPDDLIWPTFVIEGRNKREPIEAMPGVERLSIDQLISEAKRARDLGIPAIAIFPVIDESLKDELGQAAIQNDNLICRAISEVKNAVPDMGIIADVALDPFTSHGHDGILHNGEILNDASLDVLCDQARVQAHAGVDIIAPSDMMDGRVGAIRETLDADGYHYVGIMAYAAKYASAFYGPFRQALNSNTLLQGDKKTYQMDPANSRQAQREAGLDIQEGADMIMVKPGLPYLDIITSFKREFDVPIMAYNVSGEYAMIRTACDQGMLDFACAVPEMLLSFKRAGADSILSYFALDAAELMAKKT